MPNLNSLNGTVRSFFGRILNREPVLVIAVVSATVSAFFVKPSPQYFGYIDWKVLSCLLSLMLVVSLLRRSGFFDGLARVFTRYCSTLRTVALVLVATTFFLSMWITNDVALITLIPFSLILLSKIKSVNSVITILVLQTIAANIGSSLTPVGNPQNLYLFTYYTMHPIDFFKAVGWFTFCGAILLIPAVYSIKNEKLSCTDRGGTAVDRKRTVLYVILFICAVLAVFNVFDHRIILILIVLVICVTDRRNLFKADFSLLGTFAAFFIAIGNLQNIPQITDFLSQIINKNVVLVSALASQIISNVPAAILLSPFTVKAEDLLRGVSLGGLGTLIASLASVITFKFFTVNYPGKTGRYLIIFSIWNIAFFAALFLALVLAGQAGF